MPDAEVVVLDNVSKAYRIYRERNQDLKRRILKGRRAVYDEFWAARDLTFSVRQGEVFGIIGANGSGKSTTLKLLAGILEPDRGHVTTRGTVAALLELGAGFHPELTGRENVFLNGALLGIPRRQINERFSDIVDFAGLGDFIDNPVKTYSSGMFVRLGFSVAINVEPEILLVDEVLAVGDEEFQQRCLERIADLKRQGRTIIIVSHSLDLVRNLCSRAIWIDHGQLRAEGPTPEMIDQYVASAHGARVVVEGRAHFGSGEVRVLGAELSGPDGGRAQTGGPARLRLRLALDDQPREIQVRFSLRRPDGLEVAVDDTVRSGPLFVAGPATTLDYTIATLPLLAGEYDVDVKVADRDGQHTFDEVRAVTRCSVDSFEGLPHEAVVALLGRWDIGQEGQP